jgi:CubicO group peptidase (beta-lactamase class C family)
MPLIRRIGSARKSNDSEVAAALQSFVESLARDDEFSGTVLLAKEGKVLFSGAYGLANKDFAVANRLDTKFNLGSMNKMFTAVAIAQLAEQGKVSFDDSLARFLPDALPKVDAQKVKIKHLLTHTSGLGDYLFTPEMRKLSYAQFRTVDEWMERIKNDALAFDPGTDIRYSNTGFLVLGKIIEQVTRESYFDYVRDHIYKPAGMTNTDAFEVDKVTPNLAQGYFKADGPAGPEWKNNLFVHSIKGGPAGGGYSTVEDLLKFALALRSNKLVDKKYLEQLITEKPELNTPGYGYGFEVHEGAVGHGGSAPGISSMLRLYLDRGYILAVMSNYSYGNGSVVQAVQDLLPAADTKTLK